MRAHDNRCISRARASVGAICRLAMIGAALAVAGCDLGVNNPGPIVDEALNDPRAMRPLVVGMGADLSAIVDDVGYFAGIASRDIWHSGAFEPEQYMQEGQIEPRHVNGLWAGMHRARWAAESGIERMQDVLGTDFASSPLAAEAYLWAGFSNRVLGENVCQAVIDGGVPGPNTDHFERAEVAFTEALALAEQQNETELVHAARAGRAQVRAALGDWVGAAADAAEVPDDFSFVALFSGNSPREQSWLVNESQIRAYFTVWGTWAAETDDPRVPWVDTGKMGVDGNSPFYRQEKYQEYGDDIDLAAGDEMRLIEAEAALREGDWRTAVERIDAVREAAGVAPVTVANEDEAWKALRQERNIVLWMEGRRLWDLRRFDDPFLADRDRCIPISENEENTNPNV